MVSQESLLNTAALCFEDLIHHLRFVRCMIVPVEEIGSLLSHHMRRSGRKLLAMLVIWTSPVKAKI